MDSDNSSGITSDRWKQIESLYNSALQLEGIDREAFLNRACAGDETLRQELRSLLSSADCTDSFLEKPALSLGLTVLGLREETMIGKNIDRYQLLELLGRGGMGEVYLALDPRLNRRVALKLLPSSIIGDQGRVLRFEQEARSASAISHPNIAHIYEIGEAQGRHFITMEYIAGKTLRQALKTRDLDFASVVDITIQVLIALSAAHEAGVVHRDIKPENIMLRDDGYVKVLDFGLAKLTENRSGGLDIEVQAFHSLQTEPGLLMGTSHYMSPEQIRGRFVDQRTDLWSVGVVLYEMLVGQRPFQGQALSDIMIAILEQEPEPLSSKRPDLPSGLQQFVVKALRKQPNERYQTAEAMLADLRLISQESEVGLNSPRTNSAGPRLTNAPSRLSQTTADRLAPSTDELSNTGGASLQFSDGQASAAPSVPRFFPAQGWPVQLGVMLLMLLVFAGFYFGPFSRGQRKLINKNFNLQFQRLNLSGNIKDIVLSPDGKYVASIVVEEGKQAIHITELATSSDLQIVQPSESGYSGLSFSPDGYYVYYLENQTETGTLYRVSKLGGGQRKILSNVNTPVTFSPDGQRIAFVRYNIPEETPDLVISRADGTDERTLARRTRENRDAFLADMNGAGPAWSPDGKALACVSINWSGNLHEMSLEVLDVANGTSLHLSSTPWYDISRIAWLADGSGLIVAATESPAAPLQLALISSPDGKIRRITNDPNNYNRISTTSDSSLFLTLNVEENTSLWRVSLAGENQFTSPVVNRNKGVSEIAWEPDGKLVYTVNDGENLNLWMRDADGIAARQLTFEHNKDFRPAIPPDERYIVFASSRAGRVDIWRIDSDGTQLKQLTSGSYEDMPSVTSDSKWVIYRTGSSIRKVPIDGGDSVTLFDQGGLYPVISPDGRLLAFFHNEQPDSQRWYLEILNMHDFSIAKSFILPKGVNPFSGLRWTPDGRSLTYVSNTDGVANLWLQPLKGGASRQLTNFKDAEILSFTWMGGAQQLMCVRSSKTYIPLLIKLS